MRISFKIIPVFECSRFSFIDVNSKQAWSGEFSYNFPFASSRKTCSTQTAQIRIFQFVYQGFGILFSRNAVLKKFIPSGFLILRKSYKIRNFGIHCLLFNGFPDRFRRCLIHWIFSHHCNWCMHATSHAGHGLYTNLFA